MSTDVKTSPFQNKPLEGIYTTADNAQQKMEAKKAEYKAAMGQFNIFEHKKANLYSRLKSAQSRGDNSLFKTTQSEYSLACNSYSDADINVSVLRDSFMSSIFYAGKMNNCAIFANSSVA
ncbi:MAG: hypothetical protein WCG95_05535 [bacterium]